MYELGALRFFHFEKEVAWGDGMVGAGACLPLLSSTLEGEVEVWRPKLLVGVPRQVIEIDRLKSLKGTIEAPLWPDYAEAMMDLCLKRGAFTDGFDLTDSWAIKEFDTAEAKEYKGLKCAGFTLSGSLDAPVQISIDLVGKSWADAARTSRGALPIDNPYASYMGVWEWDAIDISKLVRTWSLKGSTGLMLDDGPLDANLNPLNLIGGWEELTLSLELVFDAETLDLRSIFAARSTHELTATFTNGSSSPSSVFTLVHEAFRLNKSPEDKSPEELVKTPLELATKTNASDELVTYSFG